LSQYEAAVPKLFEKAIEMARKAMPSSPSPVAHAKHQRELISQAEAVYRMGKLDESSRAITRRPNCLRNPCCHFTRAMHYATNQKLETASRNVIWPLPLIRSNGSLTDQSRCPERSGKK